MAPSRLSRFLAASSLVALASTSILPDLHSFKASNTRLAKKGAWTYGVIGDSWASGVSYNKETLYDDNKDHCLRTKESHGPQMEADASWLGDYISDLRDAACSGSQLVDLAKGQYQVGKVGQPDMIVMTSGGNNAGFGPILNVCVYHPDPTTSYGPAYKDDKDGTGECAKALRQTSNYIRNAMEQDLINTINDILADPNISNNPDFLLYLTGYAQFFGTDYDPWCNKEAWNIPSLRGTPTPYLSAELRTVFNDHVSAVNTLYRKTVASNFADKARYIDIDAAFSGHRFCEPGATHDDQFNKDTSFDDVYLWNLNPPWDVADEDPPAGQDPNNLTAQEAEDLFDGQGVTAWTGGSGRSNDPSNGWHFRPFHPRTTGYTAIKNAILAQLKTDGLPKAGSGSSPTPTPSTSPSPSSTPQAYAPGTCSFHLDEWQNCSGDKKNLFAKIKMFDNDKNVIGQTVVDPKTNPPGDGINAGDPLNFQSKLPFALQVTGEHKGDYVQFNYNGFNFKSTESQCKAGGWDPRGRPRCSIKEPDATNVSPCSSLCLDTFKADASNSTNKWIALFHAR